MEKYYDNSAIIQVIACIYLNPTLLDLEDRYKFNEEDFVNEFHRVLFGSIYNLYSLGAKTIDLITIENYLEQKPNKYGIYKINKGSEYLTKISAIAQPNAFDYYYQRMKKMTLLRMYSKNGMDLKWIYDDNNILDAKKKQKQEEWLDNHTLNEVADEIDKKITNIRIKYAEQGDTEFFDAGKGIDILLKRLAEKPDVGYPLFGPYVNTIHRGARLKKFYLRSAASGTGKTRTMIADACYIACEEMYDLKSNKWIGTGPRESVLYISTEQEEDEIQTMMLAFLSGVNEEIIVNSNCTPDEFERVKYAAQLLSKAKLYVKKLPDFSLQDIENTIRYGVREYRAAYVFYDYIHSSMKILSEVGTRSGVKNMREDNILYLISVKMKEICNEYGVFIMSSTQLNGEYREAKIYDQNLLRGAKAIADKIDVGMILLNTDEDDLASLEGIIKRGNFQKPNVKMSVYKNRRGKYKDVLVWCKADLGVCRIEPMFATDYQYRLIPMEDLQIKVNKEEFDISVF